MCGFVGAFAARRIPSIDDRARLAAATDCLAHRGPDGRGVWIAPAGDAFLGHRRLSIIDVAGGAQPLTNERANVRFCYNGEIYNFRELRSALQRTGHTFATATDGEAVVHLYEDRPADFERELRGMFALAIVDEAAGALTLVRDRLGIKPLFFARLPDRLIFGSELKAILALLDRPPEVDRRALREYLRWKYVPSPRTIYRDVYELPPGCRLVATRAGDGSLAIRIDRYWLPESIRTTLRDEAAVVDELDRRVREAVACHLESDVEVGALLSGGVDSSLVVSLAARESRRRIKTFAVGFREEGFDQLPFARTLARHAGTEHHEEYVDLDPRAAMQQLVACFDQPFGDSSALACLAVCRTAAKHVKVALTGDGGDEAYCGYQRHVEMLRPHGGGGVAALVYTPLATLVSPEAKFLRRMRADRLAPLPAYDDRELTCSDWLADRLIPAQASLERDFDRAMFAVTADRWALAGEDAADAASFRDVVHYLPGDILQKVDRTSMACSLECRPPLLDHQLIEFALSVPAAMRMAGGEPKHLLKKIAERHVPRELIYRKKRGFRVPIRRWLKGGLLTDAQRDLPDGRCVELGLLDRRGVEWVLSRQRLPWFNLSSLLWSLLMLEFWARQRL